ncbi:MAG: protoporphyrinogen oxidase [Deltaproteobacteria bacterium]|nr:protoporphyrinogen oxidase [Deltaproteobacteria bacterium]
MKNVVIVGGGISGLSTAYFLKELARENNAGPLNITIVDKKDAIGGNIITELTDGFLIEGGPDCFLSEKPWAMALCKRLGLEDRLLATKSPRGKTYVLSNGKLHLLPEGVILMVPTKMFPLLFSSLMTLSGKIRMGLELFVPKKKTPGDETLGEFVRRRLGKEALDKIAGPLVAGVHAGDPDTMSIKSSFPKFVEMEQNYGSLIKGMLARMKLMKAKPRKGGKPVTMFMTVKGGLGEVVKTLLSKIKDVNILSSTVVSKMENNDDGYELTLDNGNVLKADAVVIATPAYATSEIVKTLDGKLTEKLGTIPYVSTATISIGFKMKDIKHPMDGFGFVVPLSEGRKIMAASWVSRKWAGRAPDDCVLIRCFVGGAFNQDLVELGDEELKQIVLDELREIMGIEATPVICRIFRWRRSMPQYTVGHEERVTEIEELTNAHKGLYITGSAFRGIGISDNVREAEETAKKVLGVLA